MARPKKVIDYEMVERLSHIHCTQEEIADILGVSTKTLQRDPQFSLIYKKGLNLGRMSLRRKQFEAANKGNITMLIWLGKQLLNQKDDAEMNQIKKEELALKKKEMELKTADPAEPDLDEYIKALGADLKAVFEDEEEQEE